MYYRGAQAAVVVFDVTNRQSFEGAKNWVKELQRRTEPGMVIALAGNKVGFPDRKKASLFLLVQGALLDTDTFLSRHAL